MPAAATARTPCPRPRPQQLSFVPRPSPHLLYRLPSALQRHGHLPLAHALSHLAWQMRRTWVRGCGTSFLIDVVHRMGCAVWPPSRRRQSEDGGWAGEGWDRVGRWSAWERGGASQSSELSSGFTPLVHLVLFDSRDARQRGRAYYVLIVCKVCVAVM